MIDTSGRRRGARRPTLVPPDVVLMLESGREASVNHMEQMAIDMRKLMTNAFPHLSQEARVITSPRFLTRMRTCAEIVRRDGPETLERAATHASDTVRGWAAFSIGLEYGPAHRDWNQPRLDEASDSLLDITHDRLATLFDYARRFALDDHFAVREWAWLGVRPLVVASPQRSLEALSPLAASTNGYERRFAVEVTRPRSVWGAHIPYLKEDPSPATTLLEAALADKSRYVQDSIANWVNDATRTRPDWVEKTTLRWEIEGLADKRVLRRARRLLTVDDRNPDSR